jgi:hypothetical protein
MGKTELGILNKSCTLHAQLIYMTIQVEVNSTHESHKLQLTVLIGDMH